MSKISQRQELRQKLTPRQILHASLLQLNLPLLEQRILHELEINPALELVELSDEIQMEDNVESEVEEESVESETEEDVEFEWEELMGEHEDYENPAYIEDDKEKLELPVAAQESFSELYLKQLQDLNSNVQELQIAEEILGNLDSQGYLTIEPLLISDRLQMEEEAILAVMHKYRDWILLV